MGNPLSSELSELEFKKQIKSFGDTEISHDHTEELNMFLKVSNDFTHFFTSCALNDFRQLRKSKPQNLIFLISHVSCTIRQKGHNLTLPCSLFRL